MRVVKFHVKMQTRTRHKTKEGEGSKSYKKVKGSRGQLVWNKGYCIVGIDEATLK